MAEKEKKSEKKSKKKKHQVKAMHVRKADSGGYVATHELPSDESGMPQPNQEHVLPDLNALKEHMDHFEPEQGGEQAPAPMPAA